MMLMERCTDSIMDDLKNTLAKADTASFIIGANFAGKRTVDLIKPVIIARRFPIKVSFSLIYIIRVKEYRWLYNER
jgi:hypothetical protein